MAKKLDVDPKVIYDVCSCKRKLLSQATQKVMPKEMQTMRDVWQDSSVTTDMPHKKHAGKRFLIVTLLDIFQCQDFSLRLSLFYPNVHTEYLFEFNNINDGNIITGVY